MGRAKSDNPKDIRFSARLDCETNHNLEKYCQKNNITKGEAIRIGINLLLTQKSKK